MPVVLNIAAGTHTLANAPFAFDGSLTASEVRLVGAVGAKLQAPTDITLFTVSAGAPLITLLGLELRSQVKVEGAELQLGNCSFKGSSAPDGGALHVSGGKLVAKDSRFEACTAEYRGGAAYVSDGDVVFSGCVFTECTASEVEGGGALYVVGGNVDLQEKTHLFDNNAAGSLDSIHIGGGGSIVYHLPAPPGHYIKSSNEPSLTLIQNTPYGDYPFPCLPGFVGNVETTAAQSIEICAGLCPAGYTCSSYNTVVPAICPMGKYCPRGSVVAQNCRAGTHRNRTGGTMQEDVGPLGCDPCPPGTFCPQGAADPTECTPGTYNEAAEAATCTACRETDYQPAFGATECKPCGMGYYCPTGSSVRIPASCDPGTFLPANTTYKNQSNCVECSIGHSCAGGSAPQKNCSLGTIANRGGMDACESCVGGKYQDLEGMTACKPCEKGSYCMVGATTALPCEGGTYSEATNLTSKEECTRTDPGWYAATGSTSQTECNPGTVAPAHKMATCDLCDPGYYQGRFAAVKCLPCADDFLGVYCPNPGTSTPSPCPGGTASNATGLSNSVQCTPVESGFYASTGSKEPEPCPASGFTCPGTANDDFNDVPGSKPILVEAGGFVEDIEVETVTFDLELAMTPTEYKDNEAALLAELALYYGVNESLISLKAVPIDGRRELTVSNGTGYLEAQKLRLTVTILVPEEVEAEAGALLDDTASSLSINGGGSSDASGTGSSITMAQRFKEKLTSLNSLEGLVLSGFNVTAVSEVESGTMLQQQEVLCPKGYCAAGTSQTVKIIALALILTHHVWRVLAHCGWQGAASQNLCPAM